MSTLIEGKWGSDAGSGRGNGWDKFIVKGLELVAEDEQRTRRYHYTTGASEAKAGVVFTAWSSADGGTSRYWICVVDPGAEEARIEGYAGCYLAGRFRVLAEAEGGTFAPRLLKWWDEGCQARAAAAKAGGPPYTHAWRAKFAAHLAEQIKRRGVAQPAPMAE